LKLKDLFEFGKSNKKPHRKRNVNHKEEKRKKSIFIVFKKFKICAKNKNSNTHWTPRKNVNKVEKMSA
jgi:hypothetical protein